MLEFFLPFYGGLISNQAHFLSKGIKGSNSSLISSDRLLGGVCTLATNMFDDAKKKKKKPKRDGACAGIHTRAHTRRVISN